MLFRSQDHYIFYITYSFSSNTFYQAQEISVLMYQGYGVKLVVKYMSGGKKNDNGKY